MVDSVIIENHETEDSVIITMWFEEKSLDEALWQFLYVAFPANDYWADCKADLGIVIGNSEWGEQIKRRFSDLDGLNKDVLGEDEENGDGNRNI
nr:D613 [uncultured bacterium]